MQTFAISKKYKHTYQCTIFSKYEHFFVQSAVTFVLIKI